MPLHTNVRVPVPAKTYFRKQKNSKYVYLYTKFFRKNGKPSNTSVNIGKLDPADNTLIPNDKYYAYFSHDNDTPYEDGPAVFEGTSSIGYTAVIKAVCKELGLFDLLDDDIALYTDMIIAVAGYMIREGSVMSYIDDYCDFHYMFDSDRVTNQQVSELFSLLNNTDKRNFFIDWIKKCSSNEYIAYDVTSISTYSNSIAEAEYGYNRDHDDLKQINIGIFTAIKSKLPVYYENYNGSLTDKINLPHVLDNARDVGIEDVAVVMDGGLFDESRIRNMAERNLKVTVGMPAHLDVSKELLDKYRNSLYNITYDTSYESNYARLVDCTVHGIKGRALIGLNTNTRDLMMKSLRKDITKRESELADKKIKKYSTVIKKARYTELFDIKPVENSDDYTFTLKEKVINEMSKNYGYFLVFTTDCESTANDILYYYREKDVDEKMFYQLKEYMGARRLHTQNQETTNGKLFVLFIALIIRSHMYQKLTKYKTIHHLTFEKCMRKLDDIRIIKRKNKPARLTKEVTKQQRDMLEIFGVNIEDIVNGIQL